MSTDRPSSHSPFSNTCPTCRRTTAQPFAVDGVCLQCAGLRAFSFEDFSLAPPLEHRPDLATDGPNHIGQYELIEEIGRGGMGRVYAARQGQLGRIVALKVLPLAGPTGAVAELELRFLREAQTVARLRHPNIISIYDSGRTAGHVYFSMDYIEGGDLARRLREQPFTPQKSAQLLQKIAGALAEAHAQGVLHRDIKPSNILLEGDEPRLADFGLAAQLENGGDLTARTSVLGTPHYLAPEALLHGSAALTVASDLYALGVVCFEMLTGRTPFAGAAPAELAALVNDREPPAPRLLAPAVPVDLETICLKCLERSPSRRYASAGALAEDLRRYLAGEPIIARPISASGRLTRWCRRRPALATVWCLITALAVSSSIAAARIARERNLTAQALAATEAAMAESREHLRTAYVAEARAIRRTTTPGRRAQALAALANAARLRSGPDLRDEAAAALMLPDMQRGASWRVPSSNGAPLNMVFSPSGDVIASREMEADGSLSPKCQLRRWGIDAPFATLEVPGTTAIGPMRFSADGELIALRYLDETLRIWRVADGREQLVLRARPLPGAVSLTETHNDDYDFSPDGTAIAVGLPTGGFSLHRTSDGAELSRWSEGPVFSTLRFSPDGRFIAAINCIAHSDTPRLRIVSMPDATLAHEINLPADAESLAWAEDSRVVAVCLSDNTVAQYDVADGRLARKFPLPARDIWTVNFAAHDQLIAGRGHGTSLHFAHTTLGTAEFSLAGLAPCAPTFSPGRDDFIFPMVDSTIVRLHYETPLGFRIIPTPRMASLEYGGENLGLDFSPDGRLVVSAHGRYTIIRDVATGHLLAECDEGISQPNDYTIALLSPQADALYRFSRITGIQRRRLDRDAQGRWQIGPAETIRSEPGFTVIERSADRRRWLQLNADDGSIRVLELRADGLHEISHWQTPGAYSAAFSPDAAQVIVNCDGVREGAADQRLRVYRTADGAMLKELPAPVSGDVKWSADGRTAVTSNAFAESYIWNTADWSIRARLAAPLGGNITSFAVSPDSRHVAVVNDDVFHFLSATDGARLFSVPLPGTSGLSATAKFSPDGQSVAVLWRDGRIDIVEPFAFQQKLTSLGLGWQDE